MNGKDIELSRRRVLGGVATIGAASAAAGAGTFAYFSDTETSSGNEITAGTINLTNPTASGTHSLPTNAKPGDSFTFQIDTTYDGSINGVDLNLNAQVTESSSEPGTETNDDGTDLSAIGFAEAVEVDTAYVEINPGASTRNAKDDITSSDSPGTPINTDISVSDDGTTDGGATDFSSSPIDLEDAINGLSGQTDYASLDQNDVVRVFMSGTINSGLGNVGQEDGVDIEVAFGVQQPAEANTTPSF